MCLEGIVIKSEGGIFNNAAQTYNHIFYFETSSSSCSTSRSDRKIKELIDKSFGSFDAFKEAFQSSHHLIWFRMGLVGCGQKGKLEIVQTGNADTPLKHGKKPVLTIDVWEHATIWTPKMSEIH